MQVSMRLLPLGLVLCLTTELNHGFQATRDRSGLERELKRAMELERPGKISEAERILLTEARKTEITAAGSIELAIVLEHLGALYIAAVRHSDAVPLLRRAIRILERLEGDDVLQLLVKTKVHLAACYIAMGRDAETAELNLPLLIKTLRNPRDRASGRAILAELALRRNDLQTAEAIYLEVLAFWTRPSGSSEDPSDIATTLNNLAVVARRQGRTSLARERLEQSLVLWQRIGGPANLNIMKTMANLAMVCMQAAEYEGAVTWLEQGTAIGRNSLGETHPFTVAMTFAYAEALKKSGRKSEAKVVAHAAIEAQKRMRRRPTERYTIDYHDLIQGMPRK
jgi:tetratricopeptide (TPR) repeat protein